MALFDWLSRMFNRRPVPEAPSVGGAGATTSWEPSAKLPLGLRQRNPGNLRPLPSGEKWRGQTGEANGFCVFVDNHHGIRACALNLRNYQRRHGISTIEAIVARYAPAADRNDEAAYVRSLCLQTDWKPRAWINLQERGPLATLVRAVIRHEQGTQPFSMDEIYAAVDEALEAP